MRSMPAATHYHRIAGIEDVMAVNLTFAGGAVGSLVSIWHDNLSRPSQRRVEVFTTDRYVSLENDWHGPLRWRTPTAAMERLRGPS